MSKAGAQNSYQLVQFTDPHIGGRPDYHLLGLDTGHTLDEVLRAIASECPNADMLLATGDISANGSDAAYRRFLHKMRDVPTPWHWLPGNHDKPALMHRLGGKYCAEVVTLGEWRLLMLDTSVEQRISGGLDDQQLLRLEALLEECRDHPVMIFMHHQPVQVGSEWIDRHMLKDGREKLLSLVRAAGNVKALVWGHVHQQFDSELGAIGLHATPSTSVQFTPGSGPFAVDEQMPGYRWFELHPDGTYATDVRRVVVSEYNVDLASSGY